MNKIEEKLRVLESDRNEAYHLIKQGIIESNKLVIDNLDRLILVLQQDAEYAKQYEAVLKAKEIIINLINELAMSVDVEDIKKIRNKVNYYITKVKKEIASREIEDVDARILINPIDSLRNNISEYIRYNKRKSNMIELYNLNNKEDLTKEEKERRSKLIRSERNFNKRIKEKYGVKTKKLELEDDKEEFEYVKIKPKKVSKTTSSETSKDDFSYLDIEQKEQKIEESKKGKSHRTPREVIEFSISKQMAKYRLVRPKAYDGGFIKNVGNLFKNLSIYRYNKGIIKEMKREYCGYYSGLDLHLLIEFAEHENSITAAVEKILGKTNLTETEKRYPEYHKEYMNCVRWLEETEKTEDKIIKKETYYA